MAWNTLLPMHLHACPETYAVIIRTLSSTAAFMTKSANVEEPRQSDTAGHATNHADNWRWRLKQQVRVDAHQWPAVAEHPDYDPRAEELFALRSPKAFLESNNPALLRQILPATEELRDNHGSTDPVGDAESTVAPGVIHKYTGRVLLIANGLCAINCRYCFRRHFPYAQQYASHDNWRAAIEYLRQRPDVREVILSGGDPLTLSTNRLRALTEQLCGIDHITAIRIHSRVPVVLPERITPDLLDWLRMLPLKKVLVIHANHADELAPHLRAVFIALRETGTTLLNQSVLLKGVNDTPETLATLSQRLFDMGILPYYLHLLDPVQGASHFTVPQETASRIYTRLQTMLPGYLVPKLVKEIPRKPSKTLLF